MQDHLDSGISVLICCPGKEVSEMVKPEQVPLDLYITPCELLLTPERIGSDVAVMVQVFTQEFAIPHLHRFTQRCRKEHISGPKLCSKWAFVICNALYLLCSPSKSHQCERPQIIAPSALPFWIACAVLVYPSEHLWEQCCWIPVWTHPQGYFICHWPGSTIGNAKESSWGNQSERYTPIPQASYNGMTLAPCRHWAWERKFID